MLKAQRANKVLTIDDADQARYAKLGYNIYDGDKLIEAGAGQTVSLAAYNKLKEELEALKAEAKKAEGDKTTAKK